MGVGVGAGMGQGSRAACKGRQASVSSAAAISRPHGACQPPTEHAPCTHLQRGGAVHEQVGVLLNHHHHHLMRCAQHLLQPHPVHLQAWPAGRRRLWPVEGWGA